jgi:hypothetical protein
MDPQATWQAMLQALMDDDRDLVSEFAVCLIDWLDKGGFSPRVLPELGQVACDPESPAYRLDRMIVTYVCSRVRIDN